MLMATNRRRARHHFLIALPSFLPRAHQHRAGLEHDRQVARVGHVRAARHVGHRILVGREHVRDEQHLDPVRAEAFEHRVVVGDEPFAIDRTRKMELVDRFVSDEIQLRPRPVHEHALQRAVRVGNAVCGPHAREL
jgi:hypothetical protein